MTWLLAQPTNAAEFNEGTAATIDKAVEPPAVKVAAREARALHLKFTAHADCAITGSINIADPRHLCGTPAAASARFDLGVESAALNYPTLAATKTMPLPTSGPTAPARIMPLGWRMIAIKGTGKRGNPSDNRDPGDNFARARPTTHLAPIIRGKRRAD